MQFGYAFHHGRFSTSVRSDQADKSTFGEGEIDMVQSFEITEFDGKVFDPEKFIGG